MQWTTKATRRWVAVGARVAGGLLVACGGAGAQVSADSGVDVEANVAYADPPHAEQHLDLYWPGTTPAATVLFIHGGSLSASGERRSSPPYRDVCRAFVDAGVACATMDYRLHPGFAWPAMPLDVASAVSVVRGRIEQRGGDPDRVFLFGHSSGCHLAAIVATNRTYLAAVGLEPGDLAGIVPMGCTLDRYDAALRRADADAIREGFRASDDVALYGTAEGWISANPAHFIGSHVPPTLVVVARGERFFPSILEQGARFVRRLKEEGVPAELVLVPGTHMSSIAELGRPGDPTFEAVVDFIRDPVAATSREDE